MGRHGEQILHLLAFQRKRKPDGDGFQKGKARKFRNGVLVPENTGKSGKVLYLKALISNILNFKTFDCVVEADGKEIFRGTTMSIALGAGKYSGGGMLQVPDAVLDDGLLDITIIPLMPLHRIIRAVPGLFTGKLLKDNPELISAKCSSLSIKPLSSPAPLVEVDGEVVGNLPVSIERLEGQLRVLKNL